MSGPLAGSLSNHPTLPLSGLDGRTAPNIADTPFRASKYINERIYYEFSLKFDDQQRTRILALFEKMHPLADFSDQ